MVEITANVPQHETVIFAHKKLCVESLRRADSLEVFLFVLCKVLHGLVADQSSEHQLCLTTFIQAKHHDVELSVCGALNLLFTFTTSHCYLRNINYKS